jgi:hypothetical protein
MFMYIFEQEISGRKVEMLSRLPRASSAWSNLLRKSGVYSMDGFGGNGEVTKAWAFSPTVDIVAYCPKNSRFIA